MTLDELKQVNIDYYINLIRIKKYQKELNPELEYQLKIQKKQTSYSWCQHRRFRV